MTIRFEGNTGAPEKGLEIICAELNFKVADDGFPVECILLDEIQGQDKYIELECTQDKAVARFYEPVQLWRLLGIFKEQKVENDVFTVKEKVFFDMNGGMPDLSRNAAMRPKSIKKLATKMALMGLNSLLLYIEDMYEVPSRKYFGYMRGRYTIEELKDCDEYAKSIGIELIPCIQTLGHMEKYLIWGEANDIRNTEDTLYVRSENTYELIEEMVGQITKAFSSKKIHLGMDEAPDAAMGRNQVENGLQDKYEVLNTHVNRVVDITNRFGLEPMIWSDLYFRFSSPNGHYYHSDFEVPTKVKEAIPNNLSLAYWDYYNLKSDIYTGMIKKHFDFSPNVIFAGGIWTWAGMVPNYLKTIVTTNEAMRACKEIGLRKVFATMWGDDGGETDMFMALAGLQLFAEHGYSKEVDAEKLRRRFETCVGGHYDDFIAISDLHMLPGTTVNDLSILDKEPNAAKYLIWEDIMIGLFDKNIEGMELRSYYSSLIEKYSDAAMRNGEWDYLFEFSEAMAETLSIKAEISIDIKKAYDDRNHKEMLRISESVLPLLKDCVENLRRVHRDMWLKDNKAFGFEIIDHRYGGVLSRIDFAINRLMGFVAGKYETLEELDAERLPYCPPYIDRLGRFMYCNRYNRISSATF